MVHRAVGRAEVTLAGHGGWRGHPGSGRWRIGEPEEGNRVAVATVEEEVLAPTAAQLNGLDQRQAQYALVEGHGGSHVATHQRQVIDAPGAESIGHGC